MTVVEPFFSDSCILTPVSSFRPTGDYNGIFYLLFCVVLSFCLLD